MVNLNFELIEEYVGTKDKFFGKMIYAENNNIKLAVTLQVRKSVRRFRTCTVTFSLNVILLFYYFFVVQVGMQIFYNELLLQ